MYEAVSTHGPRFCNRCGNNREVAPLPHLDSEQPRHFVSGCGAKRHRGTDYCPPPLPSPSSETLLIIPFLSRATLRHVGRRQSAHVPVTNGSPQLRGGAPAMCSFLNRHYMLLSISATKKYAANRIRNAPKGRLRWTCRCQTDTRAPRYVPGITPMAR